MNRAKELRLELEYLRTRLKPVYETNEVKDYETELERSRMLEHRIQELYGAFFHEVSKILYRHNPLDYPGLPPDEYEPEAATILARLEEAHSLRELRRIIYEELSWWFGVESVGPESRWEEAAREVWAAWQRHSKKG